MVRKLHVAKLQQIFQAAYAVFIVGAASSKTHKRTKKKS